MGLFTPFYMKVTIHAKNTEKDKASRAVWTLTNPKKLCRAARDAKFWAVQIAAVRRLIELGDEEALTRVALDCKDDEGHKIEVVIGGIQSQAILERLAKTAPSRSTRARAVERVESQAALAEIARGDVAAGVREVATRRLIDSVVLAQVALEDPDDNVKCAAVHNPNLNDPAALAKVALETKHWRTRQNAIENPNFTDTDALAKLALEDQDCRLDAVKNPHLTDPAVLAKVALGDRSASVRRAAVEKPELVDPELLAKIALVDDKEEVRLAAVNKTALTDPEVLTRIALHDANRAVRAAAILRPEITDQALFARIAREDADRDVRAAAVNRLEVVDALAQIAGKDGGKGEKSRWLAALKLSHRAPLRAVEPLVKLMLLDRDTPFYGTVAPGNPMKMEDLRKEVVAFLENQYRHTTSPEVKNAFASLPDGMYGYLEYDHCSHDDQWVHFDVGR